MIPSDLMPFWLTLGRPLTRLLFAMCIGLLIANIVEALRWTQPLARLSAPLVRLARLREAAGASFSMAFFSPAAANALLSDSHAKGEISLRELVLATCSTACPPTWSICRPCCSCSGPCSALPPLSIRG